MGKVLYFELRSKHEISDYSDEMVIVVEMRLIIGLVLIFILVFMPSLMWLLLRQVHSPWWLENALSTPFIILVIYSVLMLALFSFISYSECVGYFLINFFLAIVLNNMSTFINITPFSNVEPFDSSVCNEPVNFFQFNIKYNEKETELNELIQHLIEEQYHLIALQGVSQRLKRMIVEQLSSHYPYFILGQNEQQLVNSDQLLFSQYAFSNIKYYKSGGSTFLISSLWQMPSSNINLYTLHPPSPRNEKLWQNRNKTLYQLNHAFKTSSTNPLSGNSSLVIGDLNLSKHSSRINLLKHGMNTTFVNSWPNKRYVLPFWGLAIDHFWISKPATICDRKRINKFSWSDHYAVKTRVFL